MNRLTCAIIDRLHDAPSSPGMMLSCYVDLTVHESTHRPGIGIVKHAATLIKQGIPDNLQDRKDFEKNFGIVVETLENPEFQHAPGIAIFTAQQRDQLEIISLSNSPRSELIYSQEPYLVPLLQAYFAQQRQYLALAFDNNQARLFTGDLAGLHLVKAWQSDVPQKQHSSGDRGGWSQSGIAHRREALLERFEREIIDQLGKAQQAHPYAGLILLGHEVSMSQLKHRLPCMLSNLLVEMGVCNSIESDSSVSRTLHEIIKKQNKLYTKSQLDELKKRQESNSRVATGAADVLAAMDGGKLSQKGCLLLGPDPREVVLRCSSCRFLTMNDLEKCPRCSSECKPCNLWEELLLRALRHDWKVVSVDSPDTLAKAEGVALLFESVASSPRPTNHE